jgi:hypothetical protein
MFRFDMDQVRLTYYYSGAFGGILNVPCILGVFIISIRRVCLLALLPVLVLIHLLVCLLSLDSVHISSFSKFKSIHLQMHWPLLAV